MVCVHIRELQVEVALPEERRRRVCVCGSGEKERAGQINLTCHSAALSKQLLRSLKVAWLDQVLRDEEADELAESNTHTDSGPLSPWTIPKPFEKPFLWGTREEACAGGGGVCGVGGGERRREGGGEMSSSHQRTLSIHVWILKEAM